MMNCKKPQDTLPIWQRVERLCSVIPVGGKDVIGDIVAPDGVNVSGPRCGFNKIRSFAARCAIVCCGCSMNCRFFGR